VWDQTSNKCMDVCEFRHKDFNSCVNSPRGCYWVGNVCVDGIIQTTSNLKNKNEFKYKI
jgi:hypothetical protein